MSYVATLVAGSASTERLYAICRYDSAVCGTTVSQRWRRAVRYDDHQRTRQKLDHSRLRHARHLSLTSTCTVIATTRRPSQSSSASPQSSSLSSSLCQSGRRDLEWGLCSYLTYQTVIRRRRFYWCYPSIYTSLSQSIFVCMVASITHAASTVNCYDISSYQSLRRLR